MNFLLFLICSVLVMYIILILVWSMPMRNSEYRIVEDRTYLPPVYTPQFSKRLFGIHIWHDFEDWQGRSRYFYDLDKTKHYIESNKYARKPKKKKTVIWTDKD